MPVQRLLAGKWSEETGLSSDDQCQACAAGDIPSLRARLRSPCAISSAPRQVFAKQASLLTSAWLAPQASGPTRQGPTRARCAALDSTQSDDAHHRVVLQGMPRGQTSRRPRNQRRNHDSVGDCQPCRCSYNPLTGLGEACYPCLTARSMGLSRARVAIRESTRSRQLTGKTRRAWTALRACSPPAETKPTAPHASKAGLHQTMGLHWGALCAPAGSTAYQMRPAQLKKTAAKTALPGRFQISTAFPLQKSAAIARPAFGAISRASTRSRCANRVRPGATLRRRAPSQRATAPCALPGASLSTLLHQLPRPAVNVPVDSHRQGTVLFTVCLASPALSRWQPGDLLLALCEEYPLPDRV